MSERGTTPSKWGFDEYPIQRAYVKLACGHTIEATEYDGGMDEIPNVGRSLLEQTVSRRVVSHAVGGCDGPMQAGVKGTRRRVKDADLMSLAEMLSPTEMETLLRPDRRTNE